MTRRLLVVAAIANLADAAAYAWLIVGGHVRETNPLFDGAAVGLAIAAKVALIVFLAALASIVTARWIRPLLVLAIAAGMWGAVSTVASL